MIYLNDFQDVWLDPVLEEDEEAVFQTVSISGDKVTVGRAVNTANGESPITDEVTGVHGIAVQLDSDGSDNMRETPRGRGGGRGRGGAGRGAGAGRGRGRGRGRGGRGGAVATSLTTAAAQGRFTQFDSDGGEEEEEASEGEEGEEEMEPVRGRGGRVSYNLFVCCLLMCE